MSPTVAILFALVLLALLFFAARRGATVFVADYEKGRLVRARGRAHGDMLGDLADVMERSRGTGRIELALGDGGVAVRTTGLSKVAEQQVRNVVGRFPAARLKTAPVVRR